MVRHLCTHQLQGQQPPKTQEPQEPQEQEARHSSRHDPHQTPGWQGNKANLDSERCRDKDGHGNVPSSYFANCVRNLLVNSKALRPSQRNGTARGQQRSNQTRCVQKPSTKVSGEIPQNTNITSHNLEHRSSNPVAKTSTTAHAVDS